MGFDWVSGITFILSLCYIVLAIRNVKLCYVFAFIGSILWAYADFSKYNLKFDGLLQLFYAVMAIVGFYMWDKQDRAKPDRNSISKLNNFAILLILIASILGSIILVFVLELITTTELPYLDSFTTILAVIGTILLISRYIESWIYLAISNVIYVYIYYSTGAYVFIGIMIIYTILAIVGYKSWQHLIDPDVKDSKL